MEWVKWARDAQHRGAGCEWGARLVPAGVDDLIKEGDGFLHAVLCLILVQHLEE